MDPAKAVFQPGDIVGGTFQVEGSLRRDPLCDAYIASADGIPGRFIVRALRVEPTSPESTAILVSELESLPELTHESIATVISAGYEQGVVWVVTEDPNGITLAERMAAGVGLPLPAVQRIVGAVARALAVLHGRPSPMAHGLVCPDTIVLGPRGDTWLEAVGITDALRSVRRLPDLRTAHRRPGYLSPDVVLSSSHAPTPAGDLFALASVAYKCLTGSSPFNGPDVASILRSLCDVTRPSVCARRPELPRGIDTVLHKAWAYPSVFASVTDFADELARCTVLPSLAASESGLAILRSPTLPPPPTQGTLDQQYARVLSKSSARPSLVSAPVLAHAALAAPVRTSVPPGVVAQSAGAFLAAAGVDRAPVVPTRTKPIPWLALAWIVGGAMVLGATIDTAGRLYATHVQLAAAADDCPPPTDCPQVPAGVRAPSHDTFMPPTVATIQGPPPTAVPSGDASEAPDASVPSPDDLTRVHTAIDQAIGRCMHGAYVGRHLHYIVRYAGSTGRTEVVRIRGTFTLTPEGACATTAVESRPLTPFGAPGWDEFRHLRVVAHGLIIDDPDAGL